MKRLTKRIVGALVIVILLMTMVLNVSAGTKTLNLYYTGSNSGNHTSESFTLAIPSNSNHSYYFVENWHSGSFSSITVVINGVSIGNLPTSAMIGGDGYPIEYSGSTKPHFNVTLNHGSGAAGFGGRINY